MNEYVEIRFRRNDKPWRVRRQVPGGVELEEPDPLQRTVGIGFAGADDITKYRMRRIRQLQGWEPNQFKLALAVEDGAIVLRGVTPLALPEGRYRVQVSLEEAKTRGAGKTVSFVEDGHAVCDIELTTDNREIAVDLAECDTAIRRVLDASSVDGQDVVEWLKADWRPTRKACLLNLLATLRIRPTVSAPLVQYVQHVFWISNDRLYAKVDRQLPGILESLALDPKKPFYREGRPKADVHLKLLDAIPESPDVKRLFTPEGLRSFRGEVRPSLQAVIAEPPAGTWPYVCGVRPGPREPTAGCGRIRGPHGRIAGFDRHEPSGSAQDAREVHGRAVLYYSIATATASRSRTRRRA